MLNALRPFSLRLLRPLPWIIICHNIIIYHKPIPFIISFIIKAITITIVLRHKRLFGCAHKLNQFVCYNYNLYVVTFCCNNDKLYVTNTKERIIVVLLLLFEGFFGCYVDSIYFDGIASIKK